MASLGGFFFIKLKCLLKVLNFNRLFLKLNRSICNLLRPTSHTSQEPWPRNCKSPKESVQRPSHYTSKIMWCGHGPSSVVWSHTWPVPSTKCYFNEFLFMRVLTYGTIEKKNQQLWAFRVPWSPSGFKWSPPPKDGFWKESQWPWNMIHSMPCRNPCRHYIHLPFTYLLRWSLKHSVKWTWTGFSAFSTNESAWSVTINGHRLSISCVKWPFL